MNNARRKDGVKPVRRLSDRVRALADQIGQAPSGLLCGVAPSDPSTASYRVARGLLGTVGQSGVALDQERTQSVAKLLERLSRSDRAAND